MNETHEIERLDYRDADYFLDAASQDESLADMIERACEADLDMLRRFELGVGETACMPAHRVYLRHPV
jgi:hypothetical protein